MIVSLKMPTGDKVECVTLSWLLAKVSIVPFDYRVIYSFQAIDCWFLSSRVSGMTWVLLMHKEHYVDLPPIGSAIELIEEVHIRLNAFGFFLVADFVSVGRWPSKSLYR